MLKIDEFLSFWRTHRRCSVSTIRAYGSDLKIFQQFLNDVGLEDIHVTPVTISEYETWLEARPNPRFHGTGLKDASVKRRLAAVASYYKFRRVAYDDNMRDPITGLGRARKTNKKPKPVSDEVLVSLLEGITDIRDRALYALMASSGLRVDEVHQLDRSGLSVVTDIDELGIERRVGTGTVVGKGQKERTFFFDEPALVLIVRYLQTRKDTDPALFLSEREQRLSIRAIQRNLQAWCRKLSLSHINVHRLRHTFATQLANANIDTMVLKDLMGHSDPSTTANYFELSRTTLAREYFAAKERSA